MVGDKIPKIIAEFFGGLIALIILVTGPARSGKSEWAERLTESMAQRLAQPGVEKLTDASSNLGQSQTCAIAYIATAQDYPDDPEWHERILKHRQRRPSHWQTLTVPYDLTATLQNLTAPHCVLIDALGTWVTNFLDRTETDWQAEVQAFCQTLRETSLTVIVVAEETGWGVIPPYPLGREFRDRLGDLTRQVGEIADQVYLVTGGYALNLTQLGQPLTHDPQI